MAGSESGENLVLEELGDESGIESNDGNEQADQNTDIETLPKCI